MSSRLDLWHRKWSWFADGWPEFLWGVEPWWQRLGCLLFGHVPIPDQCGIPDHDYCAYCQKSMPGQGKERGGDDG